MTLVKIAIIVTIGSRSISDRIYLDHAATTPLRPEAKAAMEEGFRIWANPSSPHAEGRRARAALEDARERVKKALGWDGEVIFTSGASEALWIALNRTKVERRIVSAVEHDSVFRAAPDAEVLGIGEKSVVDRGQLNDFLKSGSNPLVAIQSVNSETGVRQPISELTAMTREAGGLLLSDCSQAAGKYQIPDCDLAVVSAHKLGGPIGIGALLVTDFGLLKPGGGHERGYRQGTENLPAILGFAAALEARDVVESLWSQDSDGEVERTAKWLDTLAGEDFEVQAILKHAGARFQPDHEEWEFTQDTSIWSISMPGVSAQSQLIRLDAAGIAVSAGSACSSGTLKRSRTLSAFGVGDEDADCTIRVSLGWTTEVADLYRFAEAWRSLA